MENMKFNDAHRHTIISIQWVMNMAINSGMILTSKQHEKKKWEKEKKKKNKRETERINSIIVKYYDQFRFAEFMDIQGHSRSPD